MQWLVKSVSLSFSKDLSHKAKAKDFKIVLEDSNTASYSAKLIEFYMLLCQVDPVHKYSA